LANESASSVRRTTLLADGRVDGLAFVDLLREGPGRYRARRQVVRVRSKLWLVIDYTLGDPTDRTTTVWTASHDLKMTAGRIPGSYELTHESQETVLTKFILASAGASTRHFRGSQVPFIGWQATNDGGRPTSALVIEQPANDSWTAFVWSLSDSRSGARHVIAQPSMRLWEGPEKWTMMLPTGAGFVRASRHADRISVRDYDAANDIQLTLTKPAGLEQKALELQNAHERALRKYPTFDDYMDYRPKATYVVLLVFVLQELFFAGYKRVAHKHYSLMRGLSIIAWLILGIWLVVIRTRLI
jgi:hypothetical protein